jgi:tetratricopeptide (TPR) repeat protein
MNKTALIFNNLKASLLFVALVLGAGVAFGQDAEIRKSKRLIDVDHADEAMAPIEAAIKQFPEEADLYYYLGYAQLKNNQLDAAAKSFDAGIKLDPKEAINYAGKGHLSMLQNRPAEAKVNLDKALDMTKSKKVHVLKAVAEAYLTHAKFAGDAVALLLKAKSIKNDAEIEILLGDAYTLQNQGGSAVTAYENAAAMDPNNGKPYYRIGVIYARPNPEESQKNFEKAVAADPEFTYAYDELIDIYYQKKQADKAIDAAEKFMKLSSDPEKNKEKLALIYVMKGDYAKANQIFKEVITTKENVRPIIWRFYIKSLQATKTSADSAESVKVSELFLTKAKPEDILVTDFVYLAELYSALHQDSLGNIQLEKALQLDPKNVEAAQVLAETHYKNKKYPEAISAYKRLAQIKTKPSPSDQLNMARAYTALEQYAQADTLYTALVQDYPTNVPVTILAAVVKANLDPSSEQGLAKPLYEKYLELTNTSPDKYKPGRLMANKYLGYYYTAIQIDVKKALTYWEEALKIDPSDEASRTAIDEIKSGRIK